MVTMLVLFARLGTGYLVSVFGMFVYVCCALSSVDSENHRDHNPLTNIGPQHHCHYNMLQIQPYDLFGSLTLETAVQFFFRCIPQVLVLLTTQQPSQKSPKNEPAASGEKMQLTNCCRMKVQHFAAAICTKNRFNVSAKVVLRGSRKGKRRLQGFNVELPGKTSPQAMVYLCYSHRWKKALFHGFSAEC